jgi:hypothetical protein
LIFLIDIIDIDADIDELTLRHYAIDIIAIID